MGIDFVDVDSLVGDVEELRDTVDVDWGPCGPDLPFVVASDCGDVVQCNGAEGCRFIGAV